MKKFKNLITGAIEVVTNPTLIEQYEKYTDRYVEVKGTITNKKDSKKEKNK